MKVPNTISAAVARLLLSVFIFAAASTHAATENTVEGVVTNVNPTAQTITIRDEKSRGRRTYFISDDTRITAADQSINLRDIKRGNTVALRYRATDAGREIVSMDIPEGDEIVEILGVEFDGERLLEGTITGLRNSKRTVTIRERETRKRQTINVPESARIVREGQEIRLDQLQKGDEIGVRYRVTDRGLILVTAAAPEPIANFDTAEDEYVSRLPKTAGAGFLWLIAALVSGFGALSLRALHR